MAAPAADGCMSALTLNLSGQFADCRRDRAAAAAVPVCVCVSALGHCTLADRKNVLAGGIGGSEAGSLVVPGHS